MIKDLDKGFYQAAKTAGPVGPDGRGTAISPLTYLTMLRDPEPPQVKAIEERLLRRFRQPDDDSFRALTIKQFAYDITGFELELEERGIRTRGPSSDVVEKFFVTADNTPLFPVFFATNIIAGIIATSLVPLMCATEQRINSHVAQKIVFTDTSSDRTLRWTGEGADIPKTKISTAQGAITLYKYARMLEATYEAVRLQHLDAFGLMLQRMGMQMGVDQTDDMLETLVNGDGTTSSAATLTNTATNGALVYSDLIKLRLAFPIGYHMDHCVVADTSGTTLLNMAEFKDVDAWQRPGDGAFQNTGEYPHALGAMWHRWTSGGSLGFAASRVVAVDGRGAIGLYREGDLLEESFQIIDKQLWQRTMSEHIGFMKLDTNACQVLNNN